MGDNIKNLTNISKKATYSESLTKLNDAMLLTFENHGSYHWP
jgi:hypothetical protein